MSDILNQSIDEFIESTGFGSREQALSNMLYGLNHTNINPPLPMNKSTYGYTFFTRPQLNLRTTNIRRVRQFYPLLTTKELSVFRYVRTMLDPRLMHKLLLNGNSSKYYNHEVLRSPLVDPKNPFIPILSNALKSMSGWPDEATPTYTSKSGVRREQIAMVDGTYETNEVFDLSCTFRNYQNDPIFLLNQIWTRYTSLVLEGSLSPYLDMILENEIDYMTRIYRLTTDNKWEYLQYISATGASFPISNPTGKLFDLNKDKVYSEQTNEINIVFKSIGAIYNDDILIKEFNDVHAIFNPEYRDFLNGDKTAMGEIPNELINVLNFRGYPYIDPNSYKIKWILPTESELFRALKKRFIKDSEIEKLSKITNNVTNDIPDKISNFLDF